MLYYKNTTIVFLNITVISFLRQLPSIFFYFLINFQIYHSLRSQCCIQFESKRKYCRYSWCRAYTLQYSHFLGNHLVLVQLCLSTLTSKAKDVWVGSDNRVDHSHRVDHLHHLHTQILNMCVCPLDSLEKSCTLQSACAVTYTVNFIHSSVFLY